MDKRFILASSNEFVHRRFIPTHSFEVSSNHAPILINFLATGLSSCSPTALQIFGYLRSLLSFADGPDLLVANRAFRPACSIIFIGPARPSVQMACAL
jgi:hypothetical protein